MEQLTILPGMKNNDDGYKLIDDSIVSKRILANTILEVEMVEECSKINYANETAEF